MASATGKFARNVTSRQHSGGRGGNVKSAAFFRLAQNFRPVAGVEIVVSATYIYMMEKSRTLPHAALLLPGRWNRHRFSRTKQ